MICLILQNYNQNHSYTNKQMLQINKKQSFIELGRFLNQFSIDNNHKNDEVLYNNLYFDPFIELIHLSQSHNGWFTPDQVYFAVHSLTCHCITLHYFTLLYIDGFNMVLVLPCR